MKGVLIVVVAALMLGVAAPAQAAPARVACDDQSYYDTFKLYLTDVNTDLSKIGAAIKIHEDLSLYGTFLKDDSAAAYIALSAEQPCMTAYKRARGQWMRLLIHTRLAGQYFATGKNAAAVRQMGLATAQIHD